LGITGALVYRGISSTEITDGGTELPKINENYVPLTDLNPGNIVLYKANNSSIYQEFVWTNSAWELLGDEGSYALKTLKLIAGDGIKINNGTNSTLTQDITIKVIPGAGLIIDANGKIAHSNNI